MTEKPDRSYAVIGPQKRQPPDYGRVVRTLSTRELLAEQAAGRGDPGYQDAVAAELQKRTTDSLRP